MTPRDPNDRRKDGDPPQNAGPQEPCDAADPTTCAWSAPGTLDARDRASRPDESGDPETVPDRVEAYLKGPTVFSA